MGTLPYMDERRLPSGRHRIPRELVADDQRRRLTEAVLAIVADRGYTAATVADVLAAAAVSRATFYEHFADKEACFLAAHREALEAALVAVAVPVSQHEDWIEQIHAGLAGLLDHLSTRDTVARAGMIHVIGGGPEADREYRDAIDAFCPFLDGGRARSAWGARLPPTVARATVGAIAGTVRDEALAGRSAALPALLPELVYVAFVPYLGDEEAERERRRAQRRRERAAAGRRRTARARRAASVN